MAIEKACKVCKTIYTGVKCSKCGNTESSDTFKGRVIVFNPEQSEIAKNLTLKEKGEFAVRLR